MQRLGQHSWGSICLANLRGSCLQSGGSWRPGVPSLVPITSQYRISKLRIFWIQTKYSAVRYGTVVPLHSSSCRNITNTWSHLTTFCRITKQSFLSHLFINLACLSVCLFVCLFVSNKRQNGWTDRAQFFCGTSRDHREGLWKIKIKKKMCFKGF